VETGTTLANTSIRQMKTVRKMLRAKRADATTRVTHRMVDKIIREKQAEKLVKTQTFFRRMFEATMERMTREKRK
jgi:hypothetical protein